MKTMGFINSHKENENRIALLPCHMKELGKAAGYLFFEQGYGRKLGISDREYEEMGASVAPRGEILHKCNIICDPKAGDAEYLGELREGTTVFGWVQASVIHGCLSYGMLMEGKKAAVLGRGNTAAGAYKALVSNAALVTVYGRRQEQQFKKEMGRFDIIVNAVLWDPGRRDHIISRDDLKHLKKRRAAD